MNKDFALFLGWNRAIPGREMDSLELFGGFSKYVASLEQNGTIDSHEPWLLDFHGGDMNGCWLLRGDRDKLLALTDTDEWLTWVSKASYLLEDFGVTHARTGEALSRRMSSFQSVIKK